MSFWEELRRRNVVRVGIAYAVAAWIILQLTDVVGEILELPPWGGKLILLMIVVGFFISLFLAWAFELTPEGIKRESEVDRSESITPQTGRKLDRMIIGLLVLGLVYFIWESRFMDRQAPAGAEPVAAGDGLPETGSEVEDHDTRDPNSIAVLPFVNMSQDEAQEYFSDGISEELLNLLARVDGLDVASRTSSFAFKNSSEGIPQIAEELRVANVLEGSVRRAGNRVRITAQLIDTTNDRQLWSDSFDRDLDDIFQVQDEIANAIVDALKTELGLELASEEIEVAAITADMDAYDLYLKGRELTIARRELNEAVALLEAAVDRDPDFARAWAMLGMASFVQPAWDVLDDRVATASMERAVFASNRALELDENLSLPWAVLGMIQKPLELEKQSYATSIDMLGRALEADPNNTTAWLWRGVRHSEAGFFEDAARDMARCLDIDPAYQNCRRHLAVVKWIMGDSEEALTLYTDLARAGFTGNDAVFVPLFFYNDQPLAGHVALNYFGAAYPGFPREVYADALENPDDDHSKSVPIAVDWLESTRSLPTGISSHLMLALRAYELIEIEPQFVNNWIWHPPYDHFRQSPHFQRVLRDMGLPAYWAEHGLPDHCRQDNDQYVCVSPASLRVSRLDRSLSGDVP